MKYATSRMIVLLGLLFPFPLASLADSKYEVETKAAQSVMRAGKCAKCHNVSMPKKGPPFQEIAAEYRNKPDAMENISKHITIPSEVEVDGEMVEHGTVKTRNKESIENLVRWILAQ